MLAIRIENLTKVYSRKQLFKTIVSRGVEDLNLEVEAGEIFGLLGLNGSGKTTTIKLILGLLRPTKGGVFVLNETVPSVGTLRKIGFLPEVPYFYKYLTAFEILKFYGELSGIDRLKERVSETLEMVGMAEVRNKRLAEFSKGMLQRIGIAQSLLHDPQILIYDEPTSGLDPLAVQEMRNLLLKLKEKGKTVFLSSHMISEIEKVCDRVGVLVSGRLVKVLKQDDWKGGGKLESEFVAAAEGSAEFGRIMVK